MDYLLIPGGTVCAMTPDARVRLRGHPKNALGPEGLSNA
jgi:hypothetical protein